MAETPASWTEVWDLLAEERTTLLAILRAVKSSGLSTADAEDLLHAFAIERLPRALELTRDYSEDERKRYVHAALRNFARSALRTMTREASGLLRFREEISSELGDTDLPSPIDETALQQALERLSPLAKAAVRLFLGVDGVPMSLREIAVVLKTTRYSTTVMVLDGLLTLALELGTTGVLTSREVEVCRRVLLNGESVASAAESLHVSQSRIRATLRHARSVVASVVRH